MSEENTQPVEIEITATNAKGETARYSCEYATPNGGGPEEAVKDIVGSIAPSVGARIKTVSRAD